MSAGASVQAIVQAANDAWAKIAGNPDRIHELDDGDLSALVAQARTAFPILDAALLMAFDGDKDAANKLLERIKRWPQRRLVRTTVKAQEIARRQGVNLQPIHLCALWINYSIGCNAVDVELGRRHARRSGRVN
jgi:triphosphoribosyl-dephospho-CoA synthetase